MSESYFKGIIYTTRMGNTVTTMTKTIDAIDQEIIDCFAILYINMDNIRFNNTKDYDYIGNDLKWECLRIFYQCKKDFVFKKNIENIIHKDFINLISKLNELPLNYDRTSHMVGYRNEAIRQINKITNLINQYILLKEKEKDKETTQGNSLVNPYVEKPTNPNITPYVENPSAPPSLQTK